MDNDNKQKKRIYCAIYTRKSTNEGLDQDFTTLDAQREAAESYILSQKSEGWVALSQRYDDGGYTGANADRPALQKLLTDIREGKIDCVVVYKVDRLSRSLLDFTRLLELFEKHNVTFVSVTQHFNTNNSMGRLTLNILLSFAQFEREIISERTRDKMAAARKKGKWLGGQPILGYDLDRENHKLIVNEKESELVQEIFNLYLKERSLLSVAMILNEKGARTKRYITKSGKAHGGVEFKNTHIQHIVRNILYTGKVKYNGQIYQGLHEPIITENIFNQVREILASNRIRRNVTKNTKNIGLLNHILRCKTCNSIMFHTYTTKGKYKYRYYVCMNAQKRGYKYCPNRSVNAQAIEDAVIDCLKKIACDTEEQKQRVELLNKSLQKEIMHLSQEQEALDKIIPALLAKIKLLKRTLKVKSADKNGNDNQLKSLQEKLKENEQLISNLRIRKVEMAEKLLSQEELKQALVVTSPVWDTLFPEEKRRILKLLLKEVDYDAKGGKLGVTLSEKGIKLLSSQIKESKPCDLNSKSTLKR